MTCTNARLPMTAVNIDVAMPSINTTAKPRTAPAPNSHSTSPAMNAVTLESAMAENARSNPAVIAARAEQRQQGGEHHHVGRESEVRDQAEHFVVDGHEYERGQHAEHHGVHALVDVVLAEAGADGALLDRG